VDLSSNVRPDYMKVEDCPDQLSDCRLPKNDYTPCTSFLMQNPDQGLSVRTVRLKM
jgi:hypothetical protein